MKNRLSASTLVPFVAVAVALLAPGVRAGDGPGGHWKKLDDIDADGDGNITLDEFRSREHQFTKMDLDGNGIIEFGEMETFREQQRSERRRVKFDQLDLDDDGVVTPDEAVEGVFQRLDTNDDGVLNKADHRRGGRNKDHGGKRRRFLRHLHHGG